MENVIKFLETQYELIEVRGKASEELEQFEFAAKDYDLAEEFADAILILKAGNKQVT